MPTTTSAGRRIALSRSIRANSPRSETVMPFAPMGYAVTVLRVQSAPMVQSQKEAGKVNEDEARAFLSNHRQAVFATIGADGRPQLSNVLVVYSEGRLLLSTRVPTAKYRNMERDPRVSV